MSGVLSRAKKSFQIAFRLANWDHMNFVRLKILHFHIVQNVVVFQIFLLPNIIWYELRNSRNIQGFAWYTSSLVAFTTFLMFSET